MRVSVKFHVLTLFPEMIEQGLGTSVIGKAMQRGAISLNVVNIRDYTEEKHGKVDDYPYAGVRVFKIEGRARGPEYVRIVTECYREAVKAYCNGTYGEEKIAAWDERLKSVFNRGFWDGYYLGQRLGEWSSKYGSAATKKKVYVAKGIKYFSGIGVAEFEMESGSLNVGDEILITGPTTGALLQKVEEIRVDLKPTEKTVKGERFSIKVPEKVRPSDRLYKMVPNNDRELK